MVHVNAGQGGARRELRCRRPGEVGHEQDARGRYEQDEKTACQNLFAYSLTPGMIKRCPFTPLTMHMM